MASPVLSIIVPVYKVEKYLPRCLDSILAQTFTDYECILVDDGSPDNCGKICEQYAKKNSHIHVIHQINQGLSAARNTGLKHAVGECVAFIDSDDYILPSYCDTMITLLKRYQADIVKCEYMKGRKESAQPKPQISVYTGKEFTEKILKDEIGSQVWQYISKRGLWQDVVFPVGRLAEDMMSLFKVTDKAGKVVSTSEKLYFYFVDRCDNISNSPSRKIKNALDRAIAFKMRFEYIAKQQYNSVSFVVMRRVIEFYNTALTLMSVRDHQYDTDIRDLSNFLKQHTEERSYKKQGIKWYIIGNCIAYFPRLYCALKGLWSVAKRGVFR